MSAGTTIDYDALAQQHGGAGEAIDYDALASQHGASPQEESQPQQGQPPANDVLTKTTGISARPPENWFQQKWNEVKQGLAGAQEGAGLPQQPTALGNAAQFAGMLGTEAVQLGTGPGIAEGAGVLEKAIPNAERAGKTFQELKGAIGNHTVAMTDRLADTLNEIKEASDTGSTLPSVINKFATRIADLDKGPLTYKEARQFYSNVSDLSASEKMAAKGKDLRLLQLFKHALGDTISQTAESAGRLQDYQNAMSEFAKSQRLKEGLSTAGKLALGAGGLGGAYQTYRSIAEMMGR